MECYSQYRLIEPWERKRTSPSGSTSRNGRAEAKYDDPAVGVEQTPRFRAFPFEFTLLRTCRPIYAEAVPILYGENVFNYLCRDCSTLETPSPISDDDEYPKVRFSDQNLDKVKYLEIEAAQDYFLSRMTSEAIAKAISYFTARGCSLQTFRVVICPDWNLKRLEWQKTVFDITANDQLRDALSKLEVSDSLITQVIDADEGMGEALERFTQKVMQAKDWESAKKVVALGAEQTWRAAGGNLMIEWTLQGRKLNPTLVWRLTPIGRSRYGA